jgi:hypothetical protein
MWCTAAGFDIHVRTSPNVSCHNGWRPWLFMALLSLQDGMLVQNVLTVTQRAHAHENLTVRMRAFWALANAGDAIMTSWYGSVA